MNKAGGYKIDTQKSVIFLYTSNEQFENEIKKTIPLIKTSKRIKYLGKNLTEQV